MDFYLISNINSNNNNGNNNVVVISEFTSNFSKILYSFCLECGSELYCCTW